MAMQTLAQRSVGALWETSSCLVSMACLHNYVTAPCMCKDTAYELSD
jgi:hypothetical protein